MQKTTVYLPDDLKRSLERAAQVRGCSEAEMIRSGIELVTDAVRPKPSVGIFASGQPDLAQRVDEALEGFGED